MVTIIIVELPHGFYAVYFGTLPTLCRNEEEVVEVVGAAAVSWACTKTVRLKTVAVS